MASVASTFKTHEPSLPELLDDIHKGTIQLPDFQRGWVWDDDRIRALIASVSLSYPIGAVMLMETGDAGLRFKPRLVEGAPSMNGTKPEKLILDGQQRLTSLYTSLRSGQPVKTLTSKKEPIDRVYFLDIADVPRPRGRPPRRRCLAVPNLQRKSDFDRKIDLDVSTDEKAYEAGYFPLAIILDWERSASWRQGFTPIPTMTRRGSRFTTNSSRRSFTASTSIASRSSSCSRTRPRTPSVRSSRTSTPAAWH